jgi:hypothetical protein
MYECFYLDTKSVPDIFKIADREMEKKYPPEKRMTEPREIPMPYIDSNPNVPGPVYITEDWYFKKKKKKMINRAKEKRDVHIEMIQLLARKDMLRIKLGELDPGKKSDSKRIAAINVDIKDIDAELEMLAWQYGINLKELDKGTRLGRFIGRLKRKGKKLIKKIKRYFEDNGEFIMNMAAIILPVIGTFICKLIFRT